MSDKKANNLVLIENGQISVYALDDRQAWEIGRQSPGNRPDILLHSTTVSRKHGRFQNMDGIWFYTDYNGKNGTVYNHKHIEAGRQGKLKSIMMRDGDVFVFGGGEKETINSKTIWGVFLEKDIEKNWRIADSKGLRKLSFETKNGETTLLAPDKGTVIEKDEGIAIYMGDLTYMNGDMKLTGM